MPLPDTPPTILAILAGSLLLLFLAEIFKNIEPEWRASFTSPAVSGLIVGAVILAVRTFATETVTALCTGLLFTLVSAWLHRRGLHVEPMEGLTAGAVTGTTAALVVSPLTDRSPSIEAAGLLLGGATAGAIYAFLCERLQRYLIPAHVVTWAAASAVVFGARFIPGGTTVALGAALFAPLAVILSVSFGRRAAIVELREESALGFFPDHEIRRATHPLLRLGKGGWKNRAVRRRFVAITHALATRKARQRIARPDLARLYQVEILKLRMELQDILTVQHSLAASGDDVPQAETMSNVSS